MKQMCKKKYPLSRLCRNELSNPRCLTVSVNRQLGLESSIWHDWGL